MPFATRKRSRKEIFFAVYLFTFLFTCIHAFREVIGRKHISFPKIPIGTRKSWYTIKSLFTNIHTYHSYKRKPKSSTITEKLKGNRLRWYGHVMRREDNHVTGRLLNMSLEGWRGRGRPKNRWIHYVRQVIRDCCE
jgi:hypothetical protein